MEIELRKDSEALPVLYISDSCIQHDPQKAVAYLCLTSLFQLQPEFHCIRYLLLSGLT